MTSVELQKFFIQRLPDTLSLFNLDTYRVRIHNVLSILKEAKTVLMGWQNNTVKMFITVQCCLSEAVSLLESDDLLLFASSDKNILINQLIIFKNKIKPERKEGGELLYLLTKVIDFNENLFIGEIIKSLDRELADGQTFPDSEFKQRANRIDKLINVFCSELLNRHHSKKYLYYCAGTLKRKYQSDPSLFNSHYDSFKNSVVDFTECYYTVAIKCTLSGIQNKPKGWPPGFCPVIPESLLTKYRGSGITIPTISPNNQTRYFITKLKAFDPNQAIENAVCMALSKFDSFHFAVENLNPEFSQAYVFYEKDGNKFSFFDNINSNLDGGWFSVIGNSKLQQKRTDLNKSLIKILDQKNIRQEAKDRIISACRHLRVGNDAKEIGQTFINFWIGLEFIFSSADTDEKTIGRLKTNLINLLEVCYVKRTFLFLEHHLTKIPHFASLGKHLWELSGVELNNVIDNLADYALKLKLMNIRDIFWASDAKKQIKQLLEKHRNDLDWHLTRIYRLRNELIHEAAIKTDIERITSNLRYYLLLTMLQIIKFFSTTKTTKDIGIDEFFYEYNLYKLKIDNDLCLQTLINVPFDEILIV